MNNMKLIMENWRGFKSDADVETKAKTSILDLEDYSYITETLGFKLQLDESKKPIISESLKEEILNEHMLFEGFIGSLLKGAKQAAGRVKNLMVTLYRIFKKPKAIKSFTYLARKAVKRLSNRIVTVLKKLINAPVLVTLKSGLEKTLSIFNKLLAAVMGAEGWKGGMICASILVLLQYVLNKAGDLIAGVMAGKVKENGAAIMDLLNKTFGANLISKISGVITDWKTWLGWIGPIVGGIKVVADGLDSVTKKMGGDSILTGGELG